MQVSHKVKTLGTERVKQQGRIELLLRKISIQTRRKVISNFKEGRFQNVGVFAEEDEAKLGFMQDDGQNTIKVEPQKPRRYILKSMLQIEDANSLCSE